jgi:sugar phosphate isomerase/epimerase
LKSRRLALYVNVPFDLLHDRLERIEALSIGVEIYVENNLLDSLLPESLQGLCSELERRGIERTVHAPYLDISLGAFDRKVREITVKRLKRAIDVARVLSARSLVLHTGYDERFYGEEKEGWIERCKESLEALLEEADQVCLLVENVFERDPSIFEEIFTTFPTIGLCFDTGHFNVFSRVPLRSWMAHLGGRVAELHLHDNLGMVDEHLPCGMGNFPFMSLGRLLRRRDLIFAVEVLREEQALEAIERGKRTILRWLTG